MKKELRGTVGLFCTMLLIITLKTIMFCNIIGTDPWFRLIKIVNIFGHMALIMILIVPILLAKGKRQAILALVIDGIYSGYLLIQLIYYRITGYFIGISTIFMNKSYEGIKISDISLSKRDILFIVIILVEVIAIISAYYISVKKSIKIKFNRSIKGAFIIILISIGIVFANYKIVDSKELTIYEYGFLHQCYSPGMTLKSMSPIGYFINDTIGVWNSYNNKLTKAEEDEVEEWMKWNREELPDNDYNAKLKGKNVFLIQVESLENFVINKSVCNEEITPNINKLVKDGIYFSQIYEQNNGGNTCDTDFMLNTSILPLGDKQTFLSYPYGNYNSMANYMKNSGYNTIGAHPELQNEYYWGANYRSFGYENIYDAEDFQLKEKVGGVFSDKEFIEKYMNVLKGYKEPIFAMNTTISSHGPFEMKEELKLMNLSKELDENRLGAYFQSIHYADHQIGKFINNLDKEGILQNSVVILIGDHGGVHKYYPELIKNAPLDGDWWKADTMQVPFVIYSPELEGAVIDKKGGQIDLMPTVLYLLGIENKMLMGRNLLNTNRDATVFLDREKKLRIVGEVRGEEDKRMLNKAYKIGELIIKKK